MSMEMHVWFNFRFTMQAFKLFAVPRELLQALTETCKLTQMPANTATAPLVEAHLKQIENI